MDSLFLKELLDLAGIAKATGTLNLEDEETNEAIDPRITILGVEDEVVTVKLPYFDDNQKSIMHSAVPMKKVNNGQEEPFYVTTVYDLMLANYGVNRGIGGDIPENYDDPKPFTPAWQEPFTTCRCNKDRSRVCSECCRYTR